MDLERHSTKTAEIISGVYNSSSYTFVVAKTKSLVRRPGFQRPSKFTPDVLRIVGIKMESDDECISANLNNMQTRKKTQSEQRFVAAT